MLFSHKNESQQATDLQQQGEQEATDLQQEATDLQQSKAERKAERKARRVNQQSSPRRKHSPKKTLSPTTAASLPL